MAKVFLGLGTNIGDKRDNLQKAVKSLEKSGVKILKRSSIYETEPIGVQDQDWFYNMVIEGQTNLSLEELLNKVKIIEKEIGREETFRWGPRLIDIDILVYGDEVLNIKIGERHLQVPHPQLKNRAFVIKPLLEIEPKAKLPDGQLISQFIDNIKGQAVKKIGTL